MSSITLEELTFEEGIIINSHGEKVDCKPVGLPFILEANRRMESIGKTNDEDKIITEKAPPEANAYMKGESITAAVVRPPYWDNVPVQYYKI